MRLLALIMLQSALLAGGQVLLKIGLGRMEPFGWNAAFWRSAALNWPFAACGLSFGCGSLLWMYIVKHYPLSTAYPMVSLSYVFGMLAAMVVFHEHIGMNKWIGVCLIIAGCCLMSK